MKEVFTCYFPHYQKYLDGDADKSIKLFFGSDKWIKSKIIHYVKISVSIIWIPMKHLMETDTWVQIS